MIRELIGHGKPSRVAVAVAGGGPVITYDQLQRQVDALTERLRQFGIRRGDRVAIALPNGLEMILCFFAAATAGTAAPLNPAYKLDEFRFYLEDTGARAVILPPRGADEARKAAGGKVRVIEAEINAQGNVELSSPQLPETSIGDGSAHPEDIALVLHTSGTTSRPKRVPLSHENLLASASNIAQTYALSEDDVSLSVMPLFHVHGLVASTLAPLLSGGRVIVVPRFNPLSFWSAARNHGVTWYSAGPTVHQLLLTRTKAGERPAGAGRLRFIRSCSAALPPATMLEMEEKFTAPVLEAYGMTEAAHQMASNPLPPGRRKPGTVGPATGVLIAILEAKGGLSPVGAKGEVAIKGASVITGYENNEEANASSFTNGWFRTGDEGHLDSEGYLTLTGRIKELIVRGGEKISPREIDEALLSHPAVAEAVSFGIPDRIYGEDVAAAVVLRADATEEDLIAHCKSKLADFKCPKAIHLLETIPRTATGKVQRRAVAEAITKGRE